MAAAVQCVAVVDDEAPVRTALRRLLRLADYDVVVFASGEELLASLGARLPDCVVLDVHMPGLSGFEVQARLKSAHREIPIVFITASDDPDLDRLALKAGDRRLLRKPFSNDELLAAIAAGLRRPDPA